MVSNSEGPNRETRREICGVWVVVGISSTVFVDGFFSDLLLLLLPIIAITNNPFSILLLLLLLLLTPIIPLPLEISKSLLLLKISISLVLLLSKFLNVITYLLWILTRRILSSSRSMVKQTGIRFKKSLGKDYVATRWYRAPELCGSFFSKYTPAIDIWSVGCIFAEMLLGKPLFPGKNVVHQLDLMTDFLGTPPPESISRIRNEKARRYLSSMRKKQQVPFSHKFPKADPLALRLLERLLAFDPKDRASAEDALADPYFSGLSNSEREPSTQPISKLEFDFERKKLTKDDVRELIYREILEYHPQMLEEYLRGGDQLSFMYPSGVDRFKRQFAHLEENQGKPGAAGGGRSTALHRHHASLPRERVPAPNGETAEETSDVERRAAAAVASTLESEEADNGGGYSARNLMKSASISGSKCIGVQSKTDKEDTIAEEEDDEIVAELTDRVASLHNS